MLDVSHDDRIRHVEVSSSFGQTWTNLGSGKAKKNGSQSGNLASGPALSRFGRCASGVGSCTVEVLTVGSTRCETQRKEKSQRGLL